MVEAAPEDVTRLFDLAALLCAQVYLCRRAEAELSHIAVERFGAHIETDSSGDDVDRLGQSGPHRDIAIVLVVGVMNRLPVDSQLA